MIQAAGKGKNLYAAEVELRQLCFHRVIFVVTGEIRHVLVRTQKNLTDSLLNIQFHSVHVTFVGTVCVFDLASF